MRGFFAIVVLSTAALFGAACGGSSKDAVATREPGLVFVRIGALAVQAEVPVPEGDAFYRGLGGRESLPDDRGMLFVFPEPGRYGFWMKDVLIPIDIIWLSAEGLVVDIQAAQPEPGVPDQQLRRYNPSGEAKYVLEVRAGLAAEKGAQVGDEAQIELP